MISHRAVSDCLFAVALVCFPLCSGQFSAAQDVSDFPKPVQTSLERSSKTGRPLLIVGARQSCGLCKRFLSELQSNPQARRTATFFETAVLDVDNRQQWSPIARKYRLGGGTLPAVIVIRPDGKPLHAAYGGPPQVAGFLAEHLTASGTPLDGEAGRGA